MLTLLPPSEGKADPESGSRLDLAVLPFPSLLPLRERLADAALLARPARPAREIYTGVLYGALGLATIPAAARRRIVIVSAQYGAIRPDDRIATYRRPIDAAAWRPLLEAELSPAAGAGPILDCRSAAYLAAWRPRDAQAERWVHVGVVREVAGRRTVVSHDAKRTRGEVARHVALARRQPRTVDELRRLVAEAFACELDAPERPGAPWRMTIVT